MVFEAWKYKQTHTITAVDTNLTDYQVQFTIYKGSGTSTGNTIYCNGHCRDDFGDIIFVEGSSTSQSSFWIESYVSGVSCVYWVKLSNISTSGSTVTIYYGNNSALNYTSGYDTFIFFDHFDNGLSQWTSYGTPTVSDSEVKITTPTMGVTTTSAVSTSSTAMRCRVVRQNVASGAAGFIGLGAAGQRAYGYDLYGGYPNANVVNAMLNGSSTGFSLEHNGSSVNIYELRRSGTTCAIYDNETLDGTLTEGSSANQYIHITGDGTAGPYIDVDWVLIRKYTTDPTHGVYTTEEYTGPNEILITCTPSAGTPPLTTSIDITTPAALNDFELLYGDGQSYSISNITTWSKSYYTNGTSGYYYYRSCRNVISGLSTSGSRIKIKLNASSQGNIVIYHASIVERSGTTSNGITTPTQLTFNNGNDGITIPTNASVYTDGLTYTIDSSKSYLITIDCYSLHCPVYGTDGGVTTSYLESALYDKQETWNLQNHTYTESGNYIWIVSELQILPTQSSFTTSHIYNTFGTYNVYAKGYNGSTLLEKYTQVSVSNNSLTASFTKSQNVNTVTFTDTSTSNPNEWYWTFGDGGTSTLKNPSHIYNTPGTYTITLYASNQQYNGFTSQTVTIANPSPVATITTTQHDDLLVPCHLTFEASPTVNASLNEYITTYSWTLNGSPISTSYKFNKYFTTYGTQTIGLTVTNNYGVTYTTSTTVTLGALPTANFSPSLYSVLSPILPYSVQFTNLSYPTDIPSTTYAWNFGDSATSAVYNPSHSYAALGIYDVSLTITNPYGSDTVVYNDAIRLSRKSKSFKEVTGIVDEFASLKIKKFDEDAMPSDLPVVYATILNENFQVVQRELPNVPGLDEFGVSHVSRTLNVFGSKIINAINEWGHKIIKAVTFNDHTGYSMYRAQEFNEEVQVTADMDMEN